MIRSHLCCLAGIGCLWNNAVNPETILLVWIGLPCTMSFCIHQFSNKEQTLSLWQLTDLNLESIPNISATVSFFHALPLNHSFLIYSWFKYIDHLWWVLLLACAMHMIFYFWFFILILIWHYCSLQGWCSLPK